MSKTTAVAGATQLKSLVIGRAWDNRGNKRNDNAPDLTVKLDQSMPMNFTLGPSAQLGLYVNERKREGKNDPDFNVTLRVPEAIANEYIALERAAKAGQQALPVSVA